MARIEDSGDADGKPDKLVTQGQLVSNAITQPTVEQPVPAEIKQLTIADIATMSALAGSFRESLSRYAKIDTYTAPDPFRDKDDYDYSIIVDREKHNRILAIIASSKGTDIPKLPWDNILFEGFIKLTTTKQTAALLKYELMPKDTNNFYPYRHSDTGKVIGYILFAFQICGLH
jgi:hypothetical protein